MIKEHVVTQRVCAITGAGGYLGSRLRPAFEREGWKVFGLSRSTVDEVPYTLDASAPDGFFHEAGVDVFIHCAWDFGLVRDGDVHEQNVAGSIRVLSQARREGVGFIVFISTLSAFDGCRSRYGQAKLAVEKRALELGATVVRPGLIFGDAPGSIVAAMARAIERLPLIPLVGNGRQVLYPCHEDDLVRLLIEIASRGGTAAGSPIIAASDQGWQFRHILAALAAARGRRARVVPVPWRAVWGLLKDRKSVV